MRALCSLHRLRFNFLILGMFEGMHEEIAELEELLGEEAKALAEDGIELLDAGGGEIPEPDFEDAADEPPADDGGGLPEGYDQRYSLCLGT